MGRPRTKEPRNRQIKFCLTEGELASIEQRAKAVGMRPVHFGRAVLLGHDRKLAAHKNNPENNNYELIYGQLVRLGNNLNQMARHCHRTGDPLPADLEPLLNDIRQIIAQVRQ